MSVTIEKQFVEQLQSAIKETIKGRLSDEFDKKIEELKKKKDEYIAGTVLNIYKYVSFERQGTDIIIKIKKDD